MQQPINADGSSKFKANGSAVIPVKFALSQGIGPFVFESIWSDNATNNANDASYLSWRSNTPLTFAQVTQLIAVYEFSEGDCAGGSLRWTVRLNDGGTNRNLDIHYQPGENGVGDQFCASGTSGANMVMRNDTNVVINNFIYSGSPYTFQSSYNTTYEDALGQLGNLAVVSISLIVDSGWKNGDQVVDLTSATVGVGGATAYTETFTPQAESEMTPTCPTREASLGMLKIAGADQGPVNEPISIQPRDTDGWFRVVDCKYMYNLATSSLMGAGKYEVHATIDGKTFFVAEFDLK